MENDGGVHIMCPQQHCGDDDTSLTTNTHSSRLDETTDEQH
jgi:hypothetical protein